MIKTLKKIFAIAMASVVSIPMQGQDLLARQAPIDRKMKAVDSVALNQLIQIEQMGSPAADLYQDWENYTAHKESNLPDTFRIDLRDFCMPTDSRVLTSNFGARWDASIRDWTSKSISAIPFALHSLERCVWCAMSRVAMAILLSYVTTMDWKPSMVICQSTWCSPTMR